MGATDKIAAAIGLIGLAVIIAVFAPLAYIWAWNQLFGSLLTIQYTFWNWLAAIVFVNLFTSSIRYRKNKA